MGTALGLAVTGSIFVVAGGETGGAGGAQHAFTVTAYVLAAIAAAAASSRRCAPTGASQRDTVVSQMI